ncbi:MAG: HEAT repeat domain-containing protein [Hormoscilla sp.]
MMISVFTTDANLIVRSWDPKLTEMTGMNGDTACGLSLKAIVPDLEARGLHKRFARVLSEGVVETLAPAFHGYLIPCPPLAPSKYFKRMQQRVTIAPLREKETIVGTIITIEDVTARLDWEREPSSDIQTAISEDQSLTAALQDRSWQVRRQAVISLQQQNTPELTEELLQLLRQEYRNPSVLNSVLQVLINSNVDPVPALIACLHESEADLRIFAALALGKRQDKRAIPALIELLSDPDKNVRYHAIEALGELRATEAVEDLTQIATRSEDFFLAFPALDALMQICVHSEEESMPAVASQLVPLLEKSLTWRVRREAVDSLAMQSDPQITVELLRLLREQHRNPSILNGVLQVLSLSNVDPIPALISCCSDADPDLRIYTALALGERQDERAIPALRQLLADDDENVRYHTIEALGRLRSQEVVEDLIAIAESGDFFLAFPAIDALIQIEDRTIASRLVALLTNDLLSVQVAEALNKLGDADVVAPMAACFQHPDAPVREIAVAIAQIHDRYKQLYEEGDYIADLVRNEITSDLAIKKLIAVLEGAKLEEVRALALLLGWLEGPEVEQALAGLLSLHDPAVRDIVIEALVAYGTRVSDLLIAQLDAEDLETRLAAVGALGRIGSTRAVPALTSLLNADPELVMATTAALGKIGDRRAFEALLELLGHADAAVRLGAIAALNSLGHPDMPGQIETLLTDSNPLVRESAVKIAGYFAYDNCIEGLFNCTSDPEERVRRAAIEHLPYVEDERVFSTLVQAIAAETPGVRQAAAHALGEWENLEAIAYLLNAFQDEDPWVRYQAVRSIRRYDALLAISESGEKGDVCEALKQLVQKDPANQVRAAAAEALGRVGSEDAVPVLASLMEVPEGDGDVARAALTALGQIQSAEAVAPLLAALNSANPERRLDALQAFRERGGAEAGVTLQWMAAADTETRIVQAAIDSLSRLASPEAIAGLLELTVDPALREACINALANVGSLPPANLESSQEYIEAIGQGLNHVHVGVRSAVVEVCGRLKHPLASQLLITALNDRDASVRLTSVSTLVNSGNRDCQNQLTSLARTDPDPSVRRAAQKGLMSM